MKEQWNFSKENLNALETGLIRDEENPHVKPTESSTRKQLKQCLKVVLYLELILLVMWASYTLWQTYPVDTNHTDITNVQQMKTYSLLRQNWINEKNTNSSEELHESEDVSKNTENLPKEIDARSNETSNNNENEYLDKKMIVTYTTENSDTEINEQHDLILPTTNDNEFTSQTTESSTVSKDYSTSNIMKDQSENISEVSVAKFLKSMEWYYNLPYNSTSEEQSNDETKTDEMLETSENNTNEESKNTLENYVFLMLILDSALKAAEPAKDFIESSNEKKPDFETYSKIFSDEYIDDSSTASQTKLSSEIDNLERVLEDKLISLENSNMYRESMLISQSFPKSTNKMIQDERSIVFDEYPKAAYSKEISNSDESEYFGKETTTIDVTENFDTSNVTENQFENISKFSLGSMEGSLEMLHQSVSEEAKDILASYIFLVLVLDNAIKTIEPSKELLESSNEEKTDFEIYSERYSDESADNSSISSQARSSTEMDNVKGILEDKLISLENSNVYKDTVISQSVLEDTYEIKTYTYPDDPETQESKDTFHTPIPVEDYFNKDTVQSIAFDENKDDSSSSDSSQMSSSLFNVNHPNYFLGLETPFPRSKIRKPFKFMDTMSSEKSYSGEGFLRRFGKRSDNSATNKDSTRSYMENKEERSDDHLMPQFLKKKIQNDIVSKFRHKIARSINNGLSNKGRSLNSFKDHGTPASVLRNAVIIRERETLLTEEIATVNEHDQELLKNRLNKYFHRLEVLAAHIDKLHERYLRLNELNDDYISNEFPSE